MDIETCIKKLGYVGVLDFATVDESGAPQVRNISAIHYEGTTLYFLTARGKSFARQLKKDGRVQILGYTKYKETIRLSGKAVEVPEAEQLNLFSDYAHVEEREAEEQVARERERKRQTAILAIQKKYGKNAILKGTDLQEGATMIERNKQIGGHKS